jgi:hypothetical protein
MANKNKTINGLDAHKDEDPTSELELLTEPAARNFETGGMLGVESDEHTTGFAELVSQPGTADETIAGLQSDLKSRAETVGKLEFELQHLKSKWTGLEKELSVLEDVMSSAVAEAKLARQENLQTNELLGKRDIKVESLNAQLQSKERELEKSAQQLKELRVDAQELKSLRGELEKSQAVESRAKLEMETSRLAESISTLRAEFDSATKTRVQLDRQTENAHVDNAQLGTKIESEQDLIADCTEAAEQPYDLAMLVPIDGDASGQCAIKTGLLSLGSSPDNDIQIESDFISRHHAQIVSNSADSILKDLNSTNGTYVNSRRIKRHALRNGDSITVGKHRFRYVKKNLGSREYETSIDGARIK